MRKRTSITTIAIDKDAHSRLQAIAEETDKSLREVVNLLVDYYVKHFDSFKEEHVDSYEKLADQLCAHITQEDDRVIMLLKEHENKYLKPILNTVLLSQKLMEKTIAGLSEIGEKL